MRAADLFEPELSQPGAPLGCGMGRMPCSRFAVPALPSAATDDSGERVCRPPFTLTPGAGSSSQIIRIRQFAPPRPDCRRVGHAGYGRSRRVAGVSQPMARTVSRRSSTQLCNRSRKGARIGAAVPWRPIRVLVSRRSITSCAVTISSRIAPGLSSCRAPRFLEKLTDVVGLYINPPDKAIVLCVDEKSQTGVEIRALNRTQPGLPLKKGRCGAMTHDYKRNGTTTLFAALDLLERKVIGDFHKRHRHREFPKFPALDQPKASRKDSSALSHG